MTILLTVPAVIVLPDASVHGSTIVNKNVCVTIETATSFSLDSKTKLYVLAGQAAVDVQRIVQVV